MKKTYKVSLTICVSVAILIASATMAYYFLVTAPKLEGERLQFEKEKQAEIDANIKAKQKADEKQKCLEIKYNGANTKGSPYRDYERNQMQCD